MKLCELTDFMLRGDSLRRRSWNEFRCIVRHDSMIASKAGGMITPIMVCSTPAESREPYCWIPALEDLLADDWEIVAW